jgi:hypothetical protein
VGSEEKKWSQPELVVLGRGTPEENVLEVCKNHEIEGMIGPDADRCSWPAGVGGGVCRGVSGS